MLPMTTDHMTDAEFDQWIDELAREMEDLYALNTAIENLSPDDVVWINT